MDIVSGHEAREGMRLRTMVTTGTWLFPEVLRKPPLYYWISGLIAKLRGGIVDPLSLRLPSGLFAGGGVLVVLWLGKYAAPYAGSAIAALILLTSPLYIQQAHSSRTDMVLCFWVTCCLLVFFSATTRAQERVRDTRLWPSLFACLLALALLSKGPIGVVLVLLPISGFVLWQHDFSPVLPLVRPGPALAFGVLGLGSNSRLSLKARKPGVGAPEFLRFANL
jgi:4-amino-4-deoxy-L-arabinose transferase-like glycosyltransferase